MASLFSLIMCIEEIVLFLHETPKRPHLQTRTMLGFISSNRTTKGGSSFLIIKGSAPRQNRTCIVVVDVNKLHEEVHIYAAGLCERINRITFSYQIQIIVLVQQIKPEL